MPEGETLFSALGVLLAVLMICGLAYWFTRYVAVSGALGGFRSADGGGRLKVLAQIGVGKDERLLVAAAGKRCFLLGVTPAGISMLAEFTGEEAEAWLQEQIPTERPSFRDALRASMGRKR